MYTVHYTTKVHYIHCYYTRVHVVNNLLLVQWGASLELSSQVVLLIIEGV